MASKVKRSDHSRIVDLYISGESKADIGREYGVGREYIRQIIDEHDPEADEKRERVRQEREEALEIQRFLDRLQEVIDNDIRCATCGGWVIRKIGGRSENKTCSQECSEAWKVLRSFPEVAGDDHRLHMAYSILRNPRNYSASQVEWAHDMVEGKPPPPNRRWLNKGSKRAEVLRKYRPEIYEELVS